LIYEYAGDLGQILLQYFEPSDNEISDWCVCMYINFKSNRYRI